MTSLIKSKISPRLVIARIMIQNWKLEMFGFRNRFENIMAILSAWQHAYETFVKQDNPTYSGKIWLRSFTVIHYENKTQSLHVVYQNDLPL